MPSMAGKTVLVTGGTGGIGRATALGLARLGAEVAITGRDKTTAGRAAAQIRTATGARVEVFAGDLARQSEVRRLSAEVLDRLPRLDVLVNNVGGYWHSRHLTSDGIERTGRIHVHDPQGERSYSGARAYSQSKLANLLFTYELARRTRGSGVCANAVHPGLVRTAFGAEDPGVTQRALVPLLRPFMQSAERGAATSVHAAWAAELQGTAGSYYADRRAVRSSAGSYDEAVAARLWQESSELVALADRL